MAEKVCTKCGKEKPLEDFVVDRRAPDGRGARCVQCKKDADREYYENHRQERLAYQKNYRAQNAEKIKEYKKQYAIDNASYLKAYFQAAYIRRKDTDWFREYRAAYYAKNREIFREKARQYYANNKRRWVERHVHLLQTSSEYREYRINSNRAYYHNNKRDITERNRRPERKARIRAVAAMRKSRKLLATPAWADPNAIRAVYSEAAFLTQVVGEPYHVDHIIPLKGVTPEGAPVSGLHVHWNLRAITGTENVRKYNKARHEDACAFVRPKIKQPLNFVDDLL